MNALTRDKVNQCCHPNSVTAVKGVGASPTVKGQTSAIGVATPLEGFAPYGRIQGEPFDVRYEGLYPSEHYKEYWSIIAHTVRGVTVCLI